MAEFNRIGIVGRSQSGKSTLMDRILRNYRRVILFDAIDERAATAAVEGYTEVDNINTLQDLVDRNYADGFRYWFHPPYDGDLPLYLSDISAWLLDIQSQHAKQFGETTRPAIALAVDEMADCFPNQAQKADRDRFSVMCRSGRHKGIHLIGATQRPAEVSTKFRGQLNKRFIFNLTEPRDLQAVAEMAGADGAVIAEQVRQLAPLEYIRVEGTSYTSGKIHF